jgi:hypothetical protein
MPFIFNPISGSFDAITTKRTDAEIKALFATFLETITTTKTNALGNPNMFYDAVECKWVEAGPQIVFDEDGNIVIDSEC